MLVLSRKPSESIYIGNDIKVMIVRIGPNNVRVGVDAPPEVNIVREELAVRNAIARETSPSDIEEIEDPDDVVFRGVAEAVANVPTETLAGV